MIKTKNKIPKSILSLSILFFFVYSYGQTISTQNLEKLNTSINSPYHDIAPVVSPDGKTLYFSRSGDPSSKGRSDIWYSSQDSSGHWRPAQPVGSPLNTTSDNTLSSISPDGNMLLIPAIYNSDGSLSSGKGFSISKNKNGKWSTPDKLPIRYFINQSNRQTGCLSNDGKVLVMSIQTNSGYGAEDIYVCFLQEDQTWSEPKNVGNTINTPFEELSPFLASDGVTMYFSSNGHKGYGSKDIFKSTRLDDSWRKWSTPENLGPSVNTSGMELNFVIPASGDYAYLVSIQNSNEHSDIYRVELEKKNQPKRSILLKGTVYNAKTKQPIAASISYQMPLSKKLSTVYTQAETGQYTLVLPYQENYTLTIQNDQFLKTTEELHLSDSLSSVEMQKDFYIIPMEKGQSIEMQNIFFERSTDRILTTSYEELDRIIQLLKDNPHLKIEIGGHTDNVAKEELNVKLSKERVNAVKKYILLKGIDDSRIKGVGYGSSKPISSNTTEETRKLNRRVEFKIIEY